MRAAQYAVRGELYLKGEELRKAGRDILYTNGKRRRKRERRDIMFFPSFEVGELEVGDLALDFFLLSFLFPFFVRSTCSLALAHHPASLFPFFFGNETKKIKTKNPKQSATRTLSGASRLPLLGRCSPCSPRPF